MATTRNQEKDFGQNGLASDKRFVKVCKLALDPMVVNVSTIQERHNRSRINENATRHSLSSAICWWRDRRAHGACRCRAASREVTRAISFRSERELRAKPRILCGVTQSRVLQASRTPFEKVLL